MRSHLFLLLILLLPIQAVADETPKVRELAELSMTYESSFFGWQAHFLNYKSDAEGKLEYWIYPATSGYGLESDIYGGFFSAAQLRNEVNAFSIQPRRKKRRGKRRRRAPEEDVVDVDMEPIRIERGSAPDDFRAGPGADGFRLIPEDLFAVYLESPQAVETLEKSFTHFNSVLRNSSGLSLRFTEAMAERMGLEELPQPEDLEAIYFASEEVVLRPAAHFAILLKTSSDAKTELLKGTAYRERIGDYLVLSTSGELLHRIKRSHEGKTPSVYDDPGFQTSFQRLGGKHGFGYLSAAHLERILSPDFVILSKRRLMALWRLARAQEMVLAYRCVAGKWPQDIKQISDEGYLAAKDATPNYSVDESGVVSDPDWGTIYKPKPISELNLEQTTDQEKRSYSQLKSGEMSSGLTIYRPFGFSLDFGPQLTFRTDYAPKPNFDEELLTALAGNVKLTPEQISNHPLQAPLAIHGCIDFEFVFGSVFKLIDGPKDDIDRKILRQQLNEKLSQFVSLEGLDFFEIFLNRFSLVLDARLFQKASPSLLFALPQTELLAVCSLHVSDSEKARTVLSRFTVGQSLEIEGVTALPFSWLRGSYMVFDKTGFVHLAFNRKSAEILAQAILKGTSQKSHLPSESQGNLLLALQPQEIVEPGLSTEWFKLYAPRVIMNGLGYHAALDSLAESLGDRELTSQFFRNPPQKILGVPVSVQGGICLIDGQSVPAEIWKDQKSRTSRIQEALQKNQADLKAELAHFQTLEILIDHTPDHTLTTVSTTNPFSTDDAETAKKGTSDSPSSFPIVPLLAMLFFGVVIGLWMRNPKKA